MSKSKWSADFRAKVAQEYLDGKASFYYLADKYHIGRATIQKWVAAYKVHGIDAFICGPGNASYTSEFKTMCVEKVISGYGSSVDIGAKYKLHPSVLESWIRLYNACLLYTSSDCTTWSRRRTRSDRIKIAVFYRTNVCKMVAYFI